MRLKTAAVFFIFLTLLMFAACGNTDEPALEKKGFLYIGLIVPLNGPLKSIGKNIVRTAKMRVDEINKQRGANERLFKLIVRDETVLGKEPAAAHPANDPRMLAVMGYMFERSFGQDLSAYAKEGIPVLLPFLNGRDIAGSETENIFQMMASDASQVRALAAHAKDKLKAKSMLAVHNGSDEAARLAKVFEESAGRKADRFHLGEDNSGIKKLIEKIYEKKVQAVFLSVDEENLLALAKTLADKKLKTALYLTHGAAFRDQVMLLSKLAPRTYFSMPFSHKSAGPDAVDFIKKYENRFYRSPTWPDVLVYDTVSLLIEAVASAGDDKKAIIKYLAEVNSAKNAFAGLAGKYWFGGTDGASPVFIERADRVKLSRLPGLGDGS